MKMERKSQKIANEANRALIDQRKALTAKTEKETSLIDVDVNDDAWKNGESKQAYYIDENGNKIPLPYAVVPTSKGGGVTVSVFSDIPKTLDPGDQARYAELMERQLEAYQAAMTPPVDKLGQPDPDWSKENQTEEWKATMDMKAQMILSAHKILKNNGFLNTPPPEFKSQVNPNKYLNAAPSTPEAEEKSNKNAEEKLSNILGGNRPTE